MYRAVISAVADGNSTLFMFDEYAKADVIGINKSSSGNYFRPATRRGFKGDGQPNLGEPALLNGLSSFRAERSRVVRH